MAKIVLGIGTSHTPMLTLDAEEWQHRAAADFANQKLNLSDGRWLSYAELQQEVGDRYSAQSNASVLARQAEICEQALDTLAGFLAEAAPDIVIIVGDDQEELFSLANNPAISIFHGAEIKTNPERYGNPDRPAWIRKMAKGYAMDRIRTFPGAPEFALELIEGLMVRNFDIGASAQVVDPVHSGFGHAFGFVIERLFGDRPIPVLPVLLNTYYPPNVPSAARCYDLGRAIAEIIERSPSAHRIVIIGSGGLSHFVVDEALDRRVIEGFSPGKEELLRTLPRSALNSGSSEILNWVVVAGALRGRPLHWLEYQPIYRTPSGTGVGVGFAAWR